MQEPSAPAHFNKYVCGGDGCVLVNSQRMTDISAGHIADLARPYDGIGFKYMATVVIPASDPAVPCHAVRSFVGGSGAEVDASFSALLCLPLFLNVPKVVADTRAGKFTIAVAGSAGPPTVVDFLCATPTAMDFEVDFRSLSAHTIPSAVLSCTVGGSKFVTMIYTGHRGRPVNPEGLLTDEEVSRIGQFVAVVYGRSSVFVVVQPDGTTHASLRVRQWEVGVGLSSSINGAVAAAVSSKTKLRMATVAFHVLVDESDVGVTFERDGLTRVRSRSQFVLECLPP